MGALSQLRIVEIASAAPASYGAGLLADFPVLDSTTMDR
jgi:hypothetical protein